MFALWTILSLLTAAGAVYLAVQWFRRLLAREGGDDAMQKIARPMEAASSALLAAGWRWLALVTGVVFVLLFLGSSAQGLGLKTALAFLLGATAAASACWFAVHCMARTAERTAQAARTSLASALEVARGSSLVPGMTAAGLGLFGVTGLMLCYYNPGENFLRHVLGFAFGASCVALFARVGSGIYRRAVTLGTDQAALAANLQPHSLHNQTVIAAGTAGNASAAGTGADLFDSYVSALIAAALIGFAVSDPDHRVALLVYPLVVAAAGALAAYASTFLVRTDETRPRASLAQGIGISAGILIVAMAALTPLVDPQPGPLAGGAPASCWSVYLSMVIGLALGLAIAKVTEYYTSDEMAPAQEIAEQSRAGIANNVIAGLTTGMASTWIPVLLLAVSIWACNHLAGPYGICIAALGLLTTLGISLGVFSHGPVAGNSNGIAALTQPEDVRKRTGALAAAALATATNGKGFAIASMALTALALLCSYRVQTFELVNAGPGGETAAQAATAGLLDLANADVVAGLLIGAMLPFLLAAMTIRAAGRAAGAVEDELRRQWREQSGVAAEPAHDRFTAVATGSALRQLIAPGTVAILAPLLTGMIFGKAAAGGLLVGALGAGVLLALLLTNAGSAFGSARNWVATGHLDGRDSEVHRTTEVGAAIGEPWQDTAGPALTVLVRLMALAALMAMPLFK